MVENEENNGYDSIEFSPSGLNLLSSIEGDSSLFVFSSTSSRLEQKWISDESGDIQIPRWLDNQTILAGFVEEILLFELGNKKPVKNLMIEGTNGIFDLDFSKDKKSVYCGDDDGYFFKIDIQTSNDHVIWNNKIERKKYIGESFVSATVRLSRNEKYLAVSDGCKRVHLVSSGDGTILLILQCIRWCFDLRSSLVPK